MTATYAEKQFADSADIYDFPIYETEVRTDNGLVVPDKRAIVRGDTDEVLSLVGTTYEVLPHTKALEPILEALDKRGAEVRQQIRTTHNGARMYARLFMQDMETNFGPNERLWPGFTVTNSLDGTRPFMSEMTLMRLVCTNGMRVPTTFQKYSSRHTKNADFNHAIETFLDVLNNPASFQFIADWNQQAGPSKRDEEAIVEAIEEVCDFPGSRFPKRYADQVTDYYQNAEDGITVWNFYNSFNSVIEHEIAGEKQKVERARDLDDNVFRTFSKMYSTN